MHIAVNGWFWHLAHTGSGQYVRKLVHTLSALHDDVKLTVLLPSGAGHQEKRVAPNLTLIHHPIRKGSLAKVWWEQIRLPRLAHQRGADLLHVPYWAPPARAPLPTVVTIHDLIPLLLPAYRGDARVRLYTAWVKAASTAADFILTDSYAARNDILAHLTVNPDTVRVVHLAADRAYTPEPARDDERIRSQWQIPHPYVLYLGGCDVRKNVKTAMAAFAKVSTAVASATFVVAGKLPNTDNPTSADPRKQAARAGIPKDRVQFLGYVEEATKPALYRGARVFLYPSTYEGFGLPPLEALSCGVPVVGSDCASLPEVVGRGGILLSPDDVDGIAGALIQLLIDDTMVSTLKRQAREQATKFSWEATAQKTWDVYRATLA
jgi:glycosyltransferase involved in cell wall biosynthesis